MFKAVILLALVAAAAANRVQMRPCPGGHPMPEWFESNDCTATRCELRRGQIFSGRAMVVPNQPFTTLHTEVQATAFGLPIEISIPDEFSNACEFLEAGARCPVTQGGQYVWNAQIPVQSFLPALSNIVVRRK